jgi:hypothetical protein
MFDKLFEVAKNLISLPNRPWQLPFYITHTSIQKLLPVAPRSTTKQGDLGLRKEYEKRELNNTNMNKPSIHIYW